MKNKFKWMPMYWADEEIDTIQLSPLEFGVYMLLTSYYWRSGGPIPNNDAVLARAARMTISEFDEVKANVLRLFELDDGFWHNHSLDSKFRDCKAVSEKKQSAANKRWHKVDGNVIHLPENK